MKKLLNIAWILVAVVALSFVPACADTVWLQNGDRLVGSVENDYFALLTPYGQIVIKADFVKALTIADSSSPDGRFHTVNNDLFSGTVLNKDIRIQLEDTSAKIIRIQDIKEILFDTETVRQQVVTAVFTMNNNDRFSGRLMDENLKIRTAASTLDYQRDQLNRLEFTTDPDADVVLLSVNGDRIHGQLLLERLRIAPDSIAQLTVKKSDLKAIQFNARKLLSKDYRDLPPAVKDADGDGVPDIADGCGDTPWDDAVNINGCSKQPVPKQTLAARTTAGAADTDNDGVADGLDQCSGTPAGAEVSSNGCPVIPDILFDFDSAQIKPRYYRVLDGVITVLKQNPALEIEIRGHTDNAGPENYNQALSEKRARMAKQYMIDRGIAAQRITARGYGSARSIASNENASGRALNRRVEIIWTK